MEDPGIPWLYVAMVAIIFVRWLLGQFKRAATVRQEMRGERRDSPDATPPPLRRGQLGEDGSRSPESTTFEPPQTLQELFEQKRREIAEAQRQLENPRQPELEPEPEPEPEPAPMPPPIPVSPSTLPSSTIQAKAAPSPGFIPPLESIGASENRSRLAKRLSHGPSIRDAIILKEILDEPKGLR